MAIATTKMSSKGQVVIPEQIRIALGLKEGAQFVVVGQGDTVILKSIEAPPMEQFKSLVAQARKDARQEGIKKADIAAAIKKVRGHRK
ncbi:MAG: AbrB/MazE/SpoVT family DNA-binding domain-containing protein [Deltaproteobacteria bacterium]|nr:AbrB/MazE/SpoVT family DNA-binding domain-containing protein [Deltaproteobacteria bacterium]